MFIFTEDCVTIIAPPVDELEERRTASQRIRELLLIWEQSRTWPKKTVKRMRQMVNHWRNQIEKNGRIGNLERLFAEKAEPIIAETLTKQRVSLQATMDALQELVNQHRVWQQTKHPLPEHTIMLRHVRKIVHEIEFGYVENVSERFNCNQQKE
jgi:hypothetical protein